MSGIYIMFEIQGSIGPKGLKKNKDPVLIFKCPQEHKI